MRFYQDLVLKEEPFE